MSGKDKSKGGTGRGTDKPPSRVPPKPKVKGTAKAKNTAPSKAKQRLTKAAFAKANAPDSAKARVGAGMVGTGQAAAALPNAGSGAVGTGKAGGSREFAVRLRNARAHKPSSQLWLQRQLNDPYVLRAKREGYRSRAAFKFLELDDKFHLLKYGQRIVDLGAAPGGWSQIAAQRVGSVDGKGKVVGIDLLEIEPIPGVDLAVMDFNDEDAPDRLKAMLGGPADGVLSDMAANTTGHKMTDHLKIIGLAELAIDFARQVLVQGGFFLCKLFQGGETVDLVNLLKRDFAIVRHVKPQASRADSAEMYVLATGFRGENDQSVGAGD